MDSNIIRTFVPDFNNQLKTISKIMSQWTHVCGCIRVDALRVLENDEKANIEKILGHIVNYGDSDTETTIPRGRGASLKYQIIENPDISCTAAFTIPIWGDLRDYNDVTEIKEWFKSVCDQLFIRNAVINIEVEHGESVAYIYP